MNAGALVYCILDAEGAYTPEGYELLDSAVAGDYELKLWRGQQHVNGQPVKFHEVSLNAKGRDFDPASQATKFKGSTSALGHRTEVAQIVANWIRRYGEFYIGSYEPRKVKLYHRMVKHALKGFDISEPYAAFDECEGKPEYFKVTARPGVVESILEGDDDFDPAADVKRLGDFREKIGVMCHLITETPYEGVNFDATYWFQEASDALIMQWFNDKWTHSPIGKSVAKVMARRNKELGADKSLGYAIWKHGIENVTVNEDEVYHFIKWNRPRLYDKMMADLNQRNAEQERLRAAGGRYREEHPEMFESDDNVDVQRMISELPSRFEQALKAACALMDRRYIEYVVTDDNVREIAADVAYTIADEFNLAPGDEAVSAAAEQMILHHVFKHIARHH